MTSVNVQFVKKSSNAKTGPIPVTNSDKNTCPSACKLKDTACYASCGYYTKLNWDKVTSGERGGPWADLCKQVDKLKPDTIWRHNVSGDLPHNEQVIDCNRLSQLVNANRGKRGFTYTHHDMSIPVNRDGIEFANQNGFTINLSGDHPAMADELHALGIAPVVSIVPEDQLTNFTTDAGNKVVICPAVVRDDITCYTCKMCAIPERGTIIGFPAHGVGKNKLEINK
jgi:hypothetical protein